MKTKNNTKANHTDLNDIVAPQQLGTKWQCKYCLAWNTVPKCECTFCHNPREFDEKIE